MEFPGDMPDVVVHAGEVLVIPSGVPHGALALEDTLDLDVFSPPRQDWLDRTDAYLREEPAKEPGAARTTGRPAADGGRPLASAHHHDAWARSGDIASTTRTRSGSFRS